MVLSYVLCGLLLLATVVAGNVGSEPLFVVAAILGIFFWASLFSLFPIIIGHYYGNSGAGGNYGVLYAIAKGTGGLYGGIISAVLIHHHGFSYGMTVAGIMAIIAGLVILPLKYFPPVWRHQDSGLLKRGDDGAEKRTGSGLSPQSAKTLPTSPAA
jgi:OFA family oxalate/formate antiporter-like MFS transporter